MKSVVFVAILFIVLIAGCIGQLEQLTGYTKEVREESKQVVGSVPTTSSPCTSKWECGAWSQCDNGRQTRVCSDVNSCENQSYYTESQLCQTSTSQSWHNITTLTGSTSKNTDVFNIKGSKWRFSWLCSKANEDDVMNIFVYREGSNSSKQILPLQKCPATEETSYVYDGNGNYYFGITVANIINWTIKVEDWY